MTVGGGGEVCPYSSEQIHAAQERLGLEEAQECRKAGHEYGYGIYQEIQAKHQRRRQETAGIRSKFPDIGAYMTALGYDAINAKGHGRTGSYTVVLNRTKLIIAEERVDMQRGW